MCIRDSYQVKVVGVRKRYDIVNRYYTAVRNLPKVEVKYGYLQGGRGDYHEKKWILSSVVT